MYQTIKEATLNYSGHKLSVKKIIDTPTGKFFCWVGCYDDNHAISLVKKFVAFADEHGEERPARLAGYCATDDNVEVHPI